MCPRCHTALPPDGTACPSCGFQLDGKRFYDPKHYHWLGVLFSALVPISMASANWGQLGDTRRRLLWLLLGFAGFSLLFLVLSWLPRPIAFLVMPTNVAISFFLRERQRPLYATALRLGARPKATWQGLLVGVGLLLGALAVPIVASTASYYLASERAIALMNQERLSEADKILEGLLRKDPEDGGVTFQLAFCRLYEARWEEAARGLERSIVLDGADPATTYACLAVARAGMGRMAEADSLARRARSMNPAIFTTVFKSDDLPTIVRFLALPPGN